MTAYSAIALAEIIRILSGVPTVETVIEPLRIVADISSQSEVVQENSKEQVTDDDIYLLAWIAMGEAEGESEEGQRLVIDTVLNRVDSESFPDSIHGVIFQENQFSCVTNGRLNRTAPTDEMIELVEEELDNRCNSETLYFTAGKYGRYGEPLFQVGNHYFSK